MDFVIRFFTFFMGFEILGIFLIILKGIPALLSFGVLYCLYLNYRVFVDPVIVVRVAPGLRERGRDNADQLLLLVVENTGHGVANDISVIADKDIPFTFSEENKDSIKPFGVIPELHPGGSRTMVLGFAPDVLKSFGDNIIRVEVKYKNRRGWPFKVNNTAVFQIDGKSFLSCTSYKVMGVFNAGR